MTRNIQDKYREWETDLIRDHLLSTSSDFIAAFINVSGDFNKASGVRNLNWFNGEQAIIVGDKRWDKRGAVGTYNYTHVFHNTIEEFDLVLNMYKGFGYRIIAAEIDDRAIPLTTFDWPDRVVVIFGEESNGLSDDILSQVDDIVYIPGRGSVRSLNVATTSGIFMYDYHMKRGYI